MVDYKETLNIDEKKNKILLAAASEFSARGYFSASTNSITQMAGISKGLLFHYFTNKQQLYLAVLDLCLEQFRAGFNKELKYLSRDVLDRIIELNLLKIKLAAQYPQSQVILTEAFLKPPSGLEEEISRRQREMYAAYIPLLFEDVDRSLFKDNIDVDKAIQMVVALVNSIGEKYIEVYREKGGDINNMLGAFIEELSVYLDIIKYGIYSKK